MTDPSPNLDDVLDATTDVERAAAPLASDASLLDLPVALPGLATEPLRSVDYAWLRMDEPANLMVINGALLFEEPLDAGRVRDLVRERLFSIPRFRQRVVRPAAGVWPVWQPVADLDIDRHLVVERLAGDGGDAELAALVGGRMGKPLDPQHPPWIFYLVEGYRGGSVLFGRLHHCLGDGIALMLVLLSLADLVPEGGGLDLDHADSNPFRALFAQAQEDLRGVREATERVMPEGMKLLLHPAQALRETSRLMAGLGVTDALGRLVLRGRDPSTVFKGPLGVAKRCAWSRSLPMTEVRELASAAGGSVTDLLSAAATGGLRRYLLEHGEPPAGLAFRAAVPVNLRPLDEMAQLGNRFGLVFLSLPVGIVDPLERMAELRRRMRQLKRSAEPLVTYSILRALGRSPLAVQRAVVRLLATKTTCVLTSVPGPQQTLYLAGKPIRDVFFWVPQAGRVGLGMSICSYAGRVRLGVATDTGLVPDPERIIAGFHDELEELRHRLI
jgi:WS/DGAT/MGAT family acyltransferase